MERKLALLILIPLIFLAGCTKPSNTPVEKHEYACSLPSKFGTIDVNVEGFPSEIEMSENQDYIFDLSVDIISAVTSDEEYFILNYTYDPTMGKRLSGSIKIPYSSFDPDGNVIPVEKRIDLFNIVVPASMVEFGEYSAILKICANLSQRFIMRFLLHYDRPEYKPVCYDAGPLGVKVNDVRSIGKSYFTVDFTIEDPTNALCVEDSKKYIFVGDAFLEIDNYKVNVVSSQENIVAPVKCDIYKGAVLKLRGKNYYKVRCIIYYKELKEKCERSGKCSLDDSILSSKGKAVNLIIKLKYPFCKEVDLGTARIIKVI